MVPLCQGLGHLSYQPWARSTTKSLVSLHAAKGRIAGLPNSRVYSRPGHLLVLSRIRLNLDEETQLKVLLPTNPSPTTTDVGATTR